MNTSYGQITLSKVNDGTSPTAYNLIVSHAAVARSQNGEYNPSSITLSGKSQTGSDPWDDYAGRFTVETTEDNTTWTNRYTSEVNENTKTYEISPDGWAVTDSEPYLLRKSAGNGDVKSIAIEKAIVGGSVVWNQLIKNGDFADGIEKWDTIRATSSAADGVLTGTCNTAGTMYLMQNHASSQVGHVCFVCVDYMPSVAGTIACSITRTSINANSVFVDRNVVADQWVHKEALARPDTVENGGSGFRIGYTSNVAVGDTLSIKNVMLFDLTLMFGPTIADYIYTQEQATAGTGVALAKAWAGIVNDYYPYDAGTIKSVEGLTAHKMTGFNLFDKSAVSTGKWLSTTTGLEENAANYVVSDYIPVFAGKAVYIPATSSARRWFYDSGKNPVAYLGNAYVQVYTPPTDGYIRATILIIGNGALSLDDICINFSDTAKNGTYEPYTAHEYHLDSSLTLRGLPKLDEDNLYYDGDVYKADGTVERRYKLDDLATITWQKRKTGTVNDGYSAVLSSAYKAINGDYVPPFLCDKYEAKGSTNANLLIADVDTMEVGLYGYRYTGNTTVIYAVVPTGTSISGNLLYELATPITESATPYTASQVSYAGGTEEYITDGIPVGHVTKYSPDITGIRCSLYFENGTTTLLDQQTVPIVSDGINGDSGKDAYTVLLTNESHTFAGGKTAAVDGQTATIGVVGYRGTVQRATTVGTITGAPTGMTTAISNNSTTSTTVTVSVTSSMTTKNGTLTIPVTVDGTVFNLIFSYAIAFTGASGVGTSGLGWRVNASKITGTDNGECYFHGYDDQNEPADTDGWVVWNGAKLTIEKGYWINPGDVAPFNTVMLHVYRTSGSSAGQRHCDVWWDSDTGKWMGYNYSGDKTTPAGKAEWTWNEATDCILATYVEPSKEGKIVSAQLFNPPKKFSELPDPKVGFDFENLEIGGRNMFLTDSKSYSPTLYWAYDINLTELPVSEETYTVQLWDVDVYHSGKTADDTGVDIYWGGSSLRLMWWHGTEFFTYVDDPDNPHYHADYLEKTITITQTQADHADAKNKVFRVYNSVMNVDGTRYLSIGKWKMEHGNKPTYWSPAPEENELEINRARQDFESSIEATNDSIDEIVDENEKKLDSLRKEIASLQESLKKSAEEANTNLSNLSSSVDSFTGTYATKFEQLDKYIRFLVDEGSGTFNGIELGPLNGTDEERLQLRVGTYTDEDGNQLQCISFARGGENIGYFDGNDLYTGNIKVKVSQRAQFGNFAFVPRNGGSLSFLKVV